MKKNSREGSSNKRLAEPQAETWNAWQSAAKLGFGVNFDETALSNFRGFFRELADRNEKTNLVSAGTSEELLWRHFYDSLSALKILPGGAISAVDVGSGGGFPGIPIKIARPEIKMTLVESITKKASFLGHVREKLGLRDLTVLNSRAEDLGRDDAHRGRYDAAVCRAVSRLSPNLEVALPLLKKNGLCVIYKTEDSLEGPHGIQSASAALGALGGALKDRFSYRIPSQEKGYCLLVFEKVSETPAAYPRRAGMPEKKPL